MRNIVRFAMYQFVLFFLLFAINVPLDRFISKPFTYVDFLATIIAILFLIIGYRIVNKVYKRFEGIRLRTKLFISIPIALGSIVFLALLENQFFG
ncbi:hypothetical protein [Oceanobacillus picturae]|uniref:hypothetical protein n=1 Tax=Oceanobacillus picturae TaxID=171693 RepID=UPI00362A7161